jgi:elongation factor Ts
MEVSASAVKELREKTGAGMMDCKKALAETGGDVPKAIDFLRQKGLASAAKKADRVVTDGAVGAYVHAGGKIGVLVEINCQTDFVARTTEFQALLKDVAMQVAAASPRFVRREEVSSEESGGVGADGSIGVNGGAVDNGLEVFGTQESILEDFLGPLEIIHDY